MPRQQARSAADELPEPADVERRLDSDIDAVHVRNYDHRDGHSVDVTLERLDGDAVLTDRSYLGPGQTTRVSGALEPGQYRLRLRVDGVERRRVDLQLDGTAAGTAIVELGNGVVSVAEGA